jgi:preprotein translocase subunit SecE
VERTHGTVPAAARDVGTMAKTNPFQFFQEVRAETAKVTWPTRRETLVTTAMVFVFVILATLFFFVVDLVLRLGVGFVLGVGA